MQLHNKEKAVRWKRTAQSSFTKKLYRNTKYNQAKTDLPAPQKYYAAEGIRLTGKGEWRDAFYCWHSTKRGSGMSGVSGALLYISALHNRYTCLFPRFGYEAKNIISGKYGYVEICATRATNATIRKK